MPIIRTVRGDIDPEGLGICPCHEHLYVERNSGWGFSPGHWQECMELLPRRRRLLECILIQ